MKGDGSMTIDPAVHPMPSGTRRIRRVLLVGLVALLAVIGYQAPVTASPSQAGAGTIQPAGLYAPKGRPQAAADAPQSLANAATHFFYAEGEVSRGISHPTGAQATLTVHRPALRGDYHSLAELAVSSANRQSIIEVGWAVKPGLFGDTQPRVFVYHWVNGGETCYNGCGFVATNPDLLGSVLPVGGQRQVVINHVVAGIDRWTISIGPPGNVEQIGYFPDSRWNNTFTEPDMVQAFGEVAAVSPQPCARMGTGSFPTASSGAQIHGVSFLGPGAPAVNLLTQAPTPAFYRVVRTSATSLRYGGPGAYAGVPPPGSACKVVVPYLLNFSRTVADQRVRQAGLVPVFTGAGGPGEPWVDAQSPAPFTEVAPGSEVRMRLESGSIP
jgi:hypothetical protein